VLTWSAFPFNSELAAYDKSLIEFGINHTHALDDYFGVKRKIAFPDRDVPGVTRSLIPILLANGIGAINESPNGAMYPTNVPPAFVPTLFNSSDNTQRRKQFQAEVQQSLMTRLRGAGMEGRRHDQRGRKLRPWSAGGRPTIRQRHCSDVVARSLRHELSDSIPWIGCRRAF
jgi:hypothetical protein